MKEQVNSLYGVLASPHYSTNNVVAANVITAAARARLSCARHGFEWADGDECSPNPDSWVMRVQRPELGDRTFDERQETLSEQIIKKLREAEAMIATGKTIGQVVQASGDQREDVPPLAKPVRRDEG